MRKLTSNLLLLVGALLFLFSGYLLHERTNPSRIAFHNTVQAVHAEKGTNFKVAKPATIRIETLGVTLPIIPASIVDGSWETTTEGVSYLTSSPIPGQKGNSILYGHNWSNLLGKLPQVTPGEMIVITYTDGSTKQFEVEYTVKVRPEDIEVLRPAKDTRITLYTCTGFLDAERFVVVGILKEGK